MSGASPTSPLTAGLPRFPLAASGTGLPPPSGLFPPFPPLPSEPLKREDMPQNLSLHQHLTSMKDLVAGSLGGGGGSGSGKRSRSRSRSVSPPASSSRIGKEIY